MAFPPPPPLSREEFRRRRAQLIAEGKPLTLRSIDPALAAWSDRTHIGAARWVVLGIAGAILLAVMMVAASGCATPMSPVRKVTLAQDSYGLALDRLSDLRAAGKISDDEAVRIEAVLIVIDNAFALAKAKARTGDKTGVNDALAVAVKSLVDVDTLITEYARK